MKTQMTDVDAPLDADFIPRDQVLHVRVKGAQRLDRAPLLFKAIWSEALSLGQKRVLLDLRDSQGDLQPEEAVDVAHLATWGLQGLRVALVVQPDRRAAALPRVAAEHGLACSGFEDEREALAWLEAKDGAQPTRRSRDSM